MPKSKNAKAKNAKSKPDPSSNDPRLVADLVREDVMAHLRTYSYHGISENGDPNITFQKDSDRDLYYVVTPLCCLLMNRVEGGEDKVLGMLDFRHWGTTGYTTAEIEHVLGVFNLTENTKVSEVPTTDEEKAAAAKIEAENQETAFRNAGASGGYAFTLQSLYGDVVAVCDKAEQNIKTIPKGLQVCGLLDRVRLILMNELTEKPKNPNQTTLPVDTGTDE